MNTAAPTPFRNLLLTVAALLAIMLGSSADTFGLFTYTDNGSSITITNYSKSAVGPVVIPTTIVGKPVTIIGYGTFNSCYEITSVTIPSSVTAIQSDAFASCFNLASISLGDGVASLEANLFEGCNKLSSISIPASVTSIADHTFDTCEGLATITVDPLNPNYSSEEGILFNQDKTTLIQCPRGKLGEYVVPDSVTTIRTEWNTSMRGAFSNGGLSGVTIGSGVTSLGVSAFANCVNLSSVFIPNGVTSIGDWAFSGCPLLTTISIPPSVTSLGYGTFAYSWNLTSVYFGGNAPTVAIGDPFNDSHEGGGGPSETVYYLRGTTGWGPTYFNRPTFQLGVSIIEQPVNATVLQWKKATFTVSAVTGTGYQWQKNGVDIPQATKPTLTITNAQTSDEAGYRVIIFNPAGNETSDVATLTVIPDTDADGLTDAEEQSTYGTDPLKADTDEDGINDRIELQTHHTNPLLKDSDGDGFEDLFEINTGFNPNSGTSSPDSASTIEGAVAFKFNAGLGISYRIEVSTDLQNWNVIEAVIIGEGGTVTRYYLTKDQPRRYFRVRKN